MSFNGSGTFNINSAGQPVVSGTVISSSTFNTLTADLATGLSTCITKDGQTTVTANIPMNSYKITGLAAGTAATDAARVGQLQAGAASVVTVAGTDTYTGTMSPSLAAYAAGNTFSFVVPNANTTAATLNIDGLGAKALTRDGSTALVAGDLVANAEVVVVYDGTRFQVLNSNSKTNFNLSGTLTVAGNTTLSGGTANGVAYLNASKVVTAGSVFTYSANGNLVVGVPTTGTALAVTGTSGTYAVDITSTNTSINNRALNVYNSAATGTTALTNHIVRLASNASGADCTLQFTDSVANNGYIGMKSGALNFGANTTTTQMTLDTSGNLLVGATSLAFAEKFQMYGSYAVFNNASYTGFIGSGSSLGTGTATDFAIRSSNALSLLSGGATERLRIASAGNVTISAPSSGVTLTLNGNLSCLSNFATGAYHSWQYNGTTNGDIGTANNAFSGGATGDFGVTSRAGNLVFGTGSTERARIDSSGNLLVGTTDTGETTGVGLKLITTSSKPSFKVVTSASTNTSGSFFAYSTGAAAYRFYVDDGGTIHATSIVITAISDQRLKENVRDIDTGLDAIMALKPRRFDWKEGKGQDKKNAAGFIAQEFGEVFPASLSTFKAGEDDVTEYLSMNHEELIPSMVKAMQEQQALIESLTARLNALENK